MKITTIMFVQSCSIGFFLIGLLSLFLLKIINLILHIAYSNHIW